VKLKRYSVLISADEKRKQINVSFIGMQVFFNCLQSLPEKRRQLHTFKREDTKQYAKPVLSTIKADYSDKFINYIICWAIEIKTLKALK
jgi:hypothetical protein